MNYDDLVRRLDELSRKTGAPTYREASSAIQELQRDLQDTRDALEAFCEKSFDQLKYPNLVKRGLEVLCKQ